MRRGDCVSSSFIVYTGTMLFMILLCKAIQMLYDIRIPVRDRRELPAGELTAQTAE